MSKQVLAVSQITQAGRLKYGQINLDLTTARIIATNAIQNLTEAGIPDGNTAGPALARVNGATDKALRLAWAATQVNEVQFAPVAVPVDLDPSAPVEVHLLAGKDANANTVVIGVSAFFGVGDTDCGGNTPTIAQATAEYKVTIAAPWIAFTPHLRSCNT
jgi:hypothetical protein